jgi:hypothetical protein
LMRLLHLIKPMQNNNTIDRKEFLLVDEVVTPHWPEGIPSDRWGVTNSSTGRNSFRSMRLLFLPVIWEQIPNPLKHEGWFGEPTPKNIKKRETWLDGHPFGKTTPNQCPTTIFGSRRLKIGSRFSKPLFFLEKKETSHSGPSHRTQAWVLNPYVYGFRTKIGVQANLLCCES